MHSSSHRFLYLHVSKTGGNSIQKVLLPFSDDTVMTKAHQDGVDRFGLRGTITPSKHATLAEYEAIQPGIRQTCQVAISVRDPYHRALSGYFSPHRWMQADASGNYRLLEPVWSEESFFNFLNQGGVPAAADWLRVDDRVVPADHVIRFESLNQDLEHFLLAIGLAQSGLPPLPHVNKSAATDTLKQKLQQDPMLRRLVLERYQEDAALFGYA